MRVCRKDRMKHSSMLLLGLITISLIGAGTMLIITLVSFYMTD